MCPFCLQKIKQIIFDSISFDNKSEKSSLDLSSFFQHSKVKFRHLFFFFSILLFYDSYSAEYEIY